MAVSISSKYGASDEFFDLFCDVCFETKETHAPVFCYCPTCIQFMCTDCQRVHKAVATSRNHKILRGSQMPKTQAEKPPRYEVCESHPTELRDLFCIDHKEVICSVCSNDVHKDCLVKTVPEASENVDKIDFDSFKDAFRGFKTNVSSIKSFIETGISNIQIQRQNMHTDAQHSKEKMIDKVHALFKDKMTNIDKVCKNQTAELVEKEDCITELEVSLDSSIDAIETMGSREMDAKLFLSLQELVVMSKQYASDLNEISESLNEVEMSFKPSQKLNDFLCSSFPLGTIDIKSSKPDIDQILKVDLSLTFTKLLQDNEPLIGPASNTDAPYESLGYSGQQNEFEVGNSGTPTGVAITPGAFADAKDPANTSDHEKDPTDAAKQTRQKISEIAATQLKKHLVKLEEDQYYCDISGIAVTENGKRLLVDTSNNKVKMFTAEMKFLSAVSLDREPRAIAVINDNEAVVSMACILQFVYINGDKLTLGQVLSLTFPVSGLTPYRDKLFITRSNVFYKAVKLVDKLGNIYWETRKDTVGGEDFKSLGFVASFFDESVTKVVVTDRINNRVVVMDGESGKCLVSRQLNDKGPDGVAADLYGNIYVCCWNSREIAVMSRDLVESRNVLMSEHGLSEMPLAIAHDHKANELIISNGYPTSKDYVQCCKVQLSE